MSEKKVCELCGGPLDPRSRSGICNRTDECAKTNRRYAMNKCRAAKRIRLFGPAPNCTNCGRIVRRDAHDKICKRGSCAHVKNIANYRANADHISAKGRLQRLIQKGYVRICLRCGGPMNDDPLHVYCNKRPCLAESQRKRNARPSEMLRKAALRRLQGVIPRERKRKHLANFWCGGRDVMCDWCGRYAGWRCPGAIKNNKIGFRCKDCKGKGNRGLTKTERDKRKEQYDNAAI